MLVFSMDREVFCGRREFLKQGVKTACGRLGKESPLKALYNYTIMGGHGLIFILELLFPILSFKTCSNGKRERPN